MFKRKIISDNQKNEIKNAIVLAEKNTSGEIKVHVEEICKHENPINRAKEVFLKLELTKTKERNGVLLYIATKSKKFAILGDEGIDAVVPDDFWESTKQAMKEHLVEKELIKAITMGVQMAGEQLKKYFPYDAESDINEISDDVSIS